MYIQLEIEKKNTLTSIRNFNFFFYKFIFYDIFFDHGSVNTGRTINRTSWKTYCHRKSRNNRKRRTTWSNDPRAWAKTKSKTFHLTFHLNHVLVRFFFDSKEKETSPFESLEEHRELTSIVWGSNIKQDLFDRWSQGSLRIISTYF